MKRHLEVALAALIAPLITTLLTLTVQAKPPLTFQSPLLPQAESSATSVQTGHITATLSFGSDKELAVSPLSFDVSQTMPARLKIIGSAFVVEAQSKLVAEQPMTIRIRYALPAGIKEDRLTLVFYDMAADKWLPLPTTIDGANDTAMATTVQTGSFALVAMPAVAALPPSAVIVDDLAAGFARYGSAAGWHGVSGTTDHYYLGHMYWTSNTISTLDNYATWTPALNAGPYQVYAFIDWDNATTQNARYQIVHNGQTTIYPVNQNIHYAEWVSLGTYDFGSAAGSNYVRLEDVTYESNLSKRIGFDAIAFVPNRVYLPLVLKNYPAVKIKSGVHLGNRSTDWTPAGGAPLDFLQRLDSRGVWPKAVVVLSNQLYYLDRPPSGGLCSIAQARVRATELYNYLGQAIRMGTKVIIRIAPSPGNFTDYASPGANHTLLSGTTPAGSDYCNGKFDKFRAIDDVATEMNEIYKVNVNQNGWSPSSFFFEPANEPNKEWYADLGDVVPKQDNSAAWQAMDAYFSALYDYAHNLNPQLLVLTPPMAQNLYAEARAFTTCEIREVIGGGAGYDWMQQTYTTKNDGYAWHNYWRQAKEFWQNNFCPDANSEPSSDHIFQYFPQWLQTEIANSGKPAFIVEADLLSPCPNPTHSIANKSTQAEATQESIWRFVSEEHGASYVIAWLLTIEFSDTSGCVGNDEIAWHEAYREGYERNWFRLWWLRDEQ